MKNHIVFSDECKVLIKICNC